MEKVARPFSRPSKDQYSDRGVSHLGPGHLLEAALPSHPELEPLLLPSESPSLGISDLQQSSTPHNTGGAGFVDHEAKAGQGSHLGVGQGAHTGTGGQGGT